ncbi:MULTISPECIES: hypothetical protein [Streptomyces]|uniref:Uncharacterized protein n=1 Tax=Streptomyces albus (strain ATCC 21838 / DSM 41398 / FERM P-419 / JCM 4703 / NBRC 107858) TaxID=1081613 RepID=A0A0B5EUH7_STRA4|nr:hypothetical protein [Streptomyces sp. SCSIO ZS0520]AJE86498.1 hypothetical protein SLNWT_6122 [Streptomyces albus]AOU80801.1 hypothetical protein SLNHY_6110 [Streptomyces albus]AYN36507.1 hypothetical protein DUI70_6013 [Streptomyces albus]
MHAYDPNRRPLSPIPSMRPAHDLGAAVSPTPIYDALYAEYRRAFKALPGDRTGEEHLTFRGFGADLTDLWAGRHDPLPGVTHHSGTYQLPEPGRRKGRHRTPPPAWQPVGRLPGAGDRVPAALPPGPRRER